MASARPTPEALPGRLADRLGAIGVRGARVCVAYSGGLDSSVLLDLLHRLRVPLALELSALHVHHGLSPNADAWAAHCEARASALQVPCRVVRVTVDPSHPAGPEAAARAARLAALRASGADCIALAHHLDDQAETVLLQALRGTGLKGLAAMAESREEGGVRWLRPLLAFARPVLSAYAAARGLAWIEDESNERTEADRNFLRRDILPRVAARFPQYRESLSRLARHAAGAQALAEALADEDARRAGWEEGGLRVDRLGALDPFRQANVLRHFLAAEGLPMPTQARLAQMTRQLLASRDDARVRLVHGGRVLRRHQGRLVIEPADGPDTPWRIDWRGEGVLALGEGRGEVRFAEATGEGLSRARAAAGDWHFAPRAGGERLRLRAGGPSRTLKNLLQEAGIPPWRRPRLPLLFHGDRLAWAPGIGLAADLRAGPGEPGLVPGWHPARA